MQFITFINSIGTNNVIDIFEQFRHSLKAQGDYGHEKELADMIQMLDSPLFKQIVTVQDSIQELGEKVHNTDQVEIDDFDITATGDLSWFREGMIFVLLFCYLCKNRPLGALI